MALSGCPQKTATRDLFQAEEPLLPPAVWSGLLLLSPPAAMEGFFWL